MSDNPYPIDPDELNMFLQAQPLEAIVGMSCDDGDCPLARFLNVQYEGSTFFVNMTTYRRCMDDVSLGLEADAVFPLPSWAADFVHTLDEASLFCDDLPVAALDALFFLHAACGANGVPLGVQHD